MTRSDGETTERKGNTMADIEDEIRRDHETAATALRDLMAARLDAAACGHAIGPGHHGCTAACPSCIADALLPLFAPSWEHGVQYNPNDSTAVHECDDQDHAREWKRDLNWEGPIVRRLRASLRPGEWAEHDQ